MFDPPSGEKSRLSDPRKRFIATMKLLLTFFFLCFSILTNRLYAWNETDPLPLPQQYTLPATAESNGSSSGYIDDEMPDMWQKPRGGVSGMFGETLLTLPLFNRMDLEVALQKAFYIINWPLKNGKGEAEVPGQNEVEGEPVRTTTSSGSATNNPYAQIGSDDGEQPPGQEQIVHTHIFEGSCCHAPGCNGGRCQCNECLDKSDIVARAKRPLEQIEESWTRKKPRVESSARHERKNVLQLLASRELTGRLSQRDIKEYLDIRLEQVSPVEPAVIQAEFTVIGNERVGTEDVFLLPTGDIISTCSALYPLGELSDEEEVVLRQLTIRPPVDRSHEEVTSTTWTLWGSGRVFILSDGRVVVPMSSGHVILSKDYAGHWKLEEFDNNFLPFLDINFWTDRYIPPHIFDLISTWDAHTLLATFKTHFPFGIRAVIGAKGDLICYTFSGNTLYKWHLVNNEWAKEAIYQHSSDDLQRDVVKIVFTQDDLIQLVLKNSGSQYFSVWIEGSHQPQEITVSNKSEFISLDPLIFQSNPAEAISVWEYKFGQWRSRILLPPSDQKRRYLNVIPLRDQRLLVIDGDLVKICIDVDGRWHSFVLYQSKRPINSVKELNDGRIVAWSVGEAIVIWDLYQAISENH